MNTEIQEQSQIKLRLDPGLKQWLKLQAVQNKRTLIREIEHRLEQSRKEDQEAHAKPHP